MSRDDEAPALTRALLRFLAAGIVLFLASRAFEPTPPLASTDEGVLMAVAEQNRWHERDPVVRRRLERNLRFVGVADPSVATAVAMNMHRSDPVARKRLVWLARQFLSAVPDPTEAELEEYLQARPDRFAAAAALDLKHTFSGDAQLPDVAGRRCSHEPSATPSLFPKRFRHATASRIDATFRRGLSDTLFDAPHDRWLGPLSSPLGNHYFCVVGRVSGAAPPLRAVRAKVRQAWLEEKRAARLRAEIARRKEPS